jgi:AAHS family 4-hydroxybenzoate transporter-like MFS transporter
MLGLGRFGGIAGSFLVAEMARANLSFTQIFAAVAIPGLISAVALLVKQFVHPEDKSTYAAAGAEALGH